MSVLTRPRRHLARVPAAALATVIALAVAVTPSAAAPGEVVVRASEAFAPCLAPALASFRRETGVHARLEVKDPDPAVGADVVVGDDSELTRVLEGGSANLASALDLGFIPWVFVSPPGAPADVKAAAAMAERVVALGGPLGDQARATLGVRFALDRLRVTRDAAELRGARYALVPRSLAGAGQLRAVPVPPLVAVAAAVNDAANGPGAGRLLEFLKSSRGRAALSACISPASEAEAGGRDTIGQEPLATSAPVYAAAVVDWWLPRCSLEHNGYNDPSRVIGAPDAVALGGKDEYLGFMSLGQAGYVTVDTGVPAVDGDGPDVRVFQTVSSEPVTLYAASSPQGPFKLVGLQVRCGVRTSGIFSHHCDFDLAGTGLAEARYFKIEDGEIYPCLKAGTMTEGADIDAIQVLNPKP